MSTSTGTSRRRRGGGDPGGDVARAAALVGRNIALLTGHAPLTGKVLPGRSHVHQVALCWVSAGGDAAVCVQVLPLGPAEAENGEVITRGWHPREAQAVAESLDLRLRNGESARRAEESGCGLRAAGPAYHLLLVDELPDTIATTTLDHRCAALEAVYLDGAGWLRFYADRKFAEGSFTRLIRRAAHDVRERLGSTASSRAQPVPRRGLC
jgi:hypothetical protein